ncbi:hypothetical protein EJ06DRAFT_532869 [Trichodelitschia bisporula]|uniref:Homeobox domain-containing protein n=1 Tax=Trichodelitschia bisporula TaxID=703511 RepID=A0A6G1HPV1_9PEZI|nr:hypothetical protein EJ06DRAFT_532869 [Trichodelitschia bisporula]
MSSSGDETIPAPSSPPSNLAFLVHNQNTLLHKLPPDVDNKPLARQKRRRTSPEDQKILEAEYARNSKPDKAARMAIVSKVALGEKEVQIWFQNRRQNSRRKSKPLDHHPSSDPTEKGAEDDAAESTDDASDPAETNKLPASSNSSTETPTLSFPVPEPRPTSYLANRRSASFNRAPVSAPAPTVAPAPVSTPRVRRTGSYLRLSTTPAGTAQIIDRATSPSPPRARPVPSPITPIPPPSLAPPSLRRTFSAANLDPTSPAAKVPRMGRSRDSRQWEFWAEAGARAKEDAESGSAVDAIGQMRRRGVRRTFGGGSAPNGQGLRRSATAKGRLEGGKKARLGLGIEDEKENWDPESGALHGVDGTVNGGGLVEKGKRDSGVAIVGPEVDPEVSKFMEGGDRGSSGKGSEDLDCVQSLLSLSQGNWGA